MTRKSNKKLGLNEQLQYFYLNVEDSGAWLHCVHEKCKGNNIKFFYDEIDLTNLIADILSHFKEYHKEHKETTERLTANIDTSDK